MHTPRSKLARSTRVANKLIVTKDYIAADHFDNRFRITATEEL